MNLNFILIVTLGTISMLAHPSKVKYYKKNLCSLLLKSTLCGQPTTKKPFLGAGKNQFVGAGAVPTPASRSYKCCL
jgi:hypothetical protein